MTLEQPVSGLRILSVAVLHWAFGSLYLQWRTKHSSTDNWIEPIKIVMLREYFKFCIRYRFNFSFLKQGRS